MSGGHHTRQNNWCTKRTFWWIIKQFPLSLNCFLPNLHNIFSDSFDSNRKQSFSPLQCTLFTAIFQSWHIGRVNKNKLLINNKMKSVCFIQIIPIHRSLCILWFDLGPSSEHFLIHVTHSKTIHINY